MSHEYNARAAGIAETSSQQAIDRIKGESIHHINSPVACGRIAMAVYGALSSAPDYLPAAPFFAEWFYNDGGELDMVPDGTDPSYVIPTGIWLDEFLG